MDRKSSKVSHNMQDIYGYNSCDITSVSLNVFKLFWKFPKMAKVLQLSSLVAKIVIFLWGFLEFSEQLLTLKKNID